ncbi:bifunctional hydroxymethylpyrimidine kinase/phosphomethylpyrimidine kinase [Candidatus Pandoraea novymonadis]|uniref:hydroxymethylpyrimidine kinase n=1 Tax=Candidatus Pandoraea novymonadis TaxID=1808959 RepID=A0ABX5FEE8_9BURK|nr:bifunctional hydroxymethylpyrimidine kinase/phosphomethylpyrimidine kinase [Candidatus Pandoraea novymonadis]PSB92050.1 Hydroxymethylpyrimidine/phosphomethylpyrimidine kinase [Candidatus Pandoraea novymonadis]
MTSDIPIVLTIAGSDSGGGAGIQADLKTFSALGAYGATVVTALTAQNTCGVMEIHIPPASFITAQLDAVFQDLNIDSVKIGMLANCEIIYAVAAALHRYRPRFVVLDTVMFSKSEHSLLLPDSLSVLREILLPLADLITPNLPEAAALLGVHQANNENEMIAQAQALRRLGARNVLIKGGHLTSANSPDWLISDSGSERFNAPRISVHHTHGTGCTLSAALAALQPQRENLSITTRDAKQYLHGALSASGRLCVGHGIGPTHHFYALWRNPSAKH